jgi:hypothetical protein
VGRAGVGGGEQSRAGVGRAGWAGWAEQGRVGRRAGHRGRDMQGAG